MLEYVALALMIFGALVAFYLVIAIHDTPYELAKHRNHPHQDAIHVAGWVMIVGAFWQNSLQRIHVGDDAEVIFRGVPGRVFQGKVAKVLPVLAQGQMQASGNLLAVERVPNAGKVPVLIDLEDDLSPYQLPAGVIGSGAIYTKHAHHVAVMRKILLRMVSWQNYVFGELH